jgi:uncharacterized coiled-coil protein SlyX
MTDLVARRQRLETTLHALSARLLEIQAAVTQTTTQLERVRGALTLAQELEAAETATPGPPEPPESYA